VLGIVLRCFKVFLGDFMWTTTMLFLSLTALLVVWIAWIAGATKHLLRYPRGPKGPNGSTRRTGHEFIASGHNPAKPQDWLHRVALQSAPVRFRVPHPPWFLGGYSPSKSHEKSTCVMLKPCRTHLICQKKCIYQILDYHQIIINKIEDCLSLVSQVLKIVFCLSCHHYRIYLYICNIVCLRTPIIEGTLLINIPNKQPFLWVEYPLVI
jgi:hypothetical protein